MTTPIWDRPTRMPLVPRIISGIVVIGILGGMGFWILDLARFERENAVLRPPTDAELAAARPRARATWSMVRANLVTRLDQTNPLDLGAVWSTRTGQICGLVNGRGSFGGLTGMVRFYSAQHTPVFHQDVEHLQFQHAWFQCRRDRWVELHAGAEEPGFCGTEMGKRRCYTVRIKDRVRSVEN
jgi:hypothetical protein